MAMILKKSIKLGSNSGARSILRQLIDTLVCKKVYQIC